MGERQTARRPPLHPTRTGIVPPGPIFLKFIPANFHSCCMTTQLAGPASSPDYSSRCANLDSCASMRKSYTVARIGEITEVVDAIVFLTDATFTTGEILHVDGGAHAAKW